MGIQSATPNSLVRIAKAKSEIFFVLLPRALRSWKYFAAQFRFPKSRLYRTSLIGANENQSKGMDYGDDEMMSFEDRLAQTER